MEDKAEYQALYYYQVPDIYMALNAEEFNYLADRYIMVYKYGHC